MNSFVTAAVVIGTWIWASSVYNKPTVQDREVRDQDVTRALDPIMGNPAIVDPPLRGGYGDRLNTFIPYVNDKFNQFIKPFDKQATSIIKSAAYANDYNMGYAQNYWESGPNTIFLDDDVPTGNNMVQYFTGEKPLMMSSIP